MESPQPAAKDGSLLVDTAECIQRLQRHHCRWRYPLGQDLCHELFVRPVGHDLLQRPAVCHVRQNHRQLQAQRAWHAQAAACSPWLQRQGAPGRKLHDRQQRRQSQRILLFRRQRREQPRPDPGHHPCRGILRRGGPDAAKLRQSGHGPLLCHRIKVLVQLQPGQPTALVLSGVGAEMPLPQDDVSPLYDGRQPVSFRGHQGQIPQPV